MGRGALLALAILCSLARPRLSIAADGAPVEVVVQGVDGDLKENVLAHLGIAVQTRGRRVSEAEARDLHGRAQKEIEIALQPYGFYRPAVWSDFENQAKRWRVHYRIDPGPPMRIDSLEVRVTGEGAEDPAFREALVRLPLHRGDVLVHAAYDDAKEALTAVAMKSGYLDGHFETHEIRVDVERNAAAVDLVYASGPRYVFGPVEFQQDVLDPELLRGYVEFHPGEPLDFNRLLELEQALGNSPYWSRVEVRPRRDLARGHELPIVVDLVPARPGKYTMGGGYGTDNGPHGRGTIELRRLNRRGHRGQIDGTLSAIEHSAAAKYQIPWPYPRTDVLTFSLGFARNKTTISDEQTRFIGTNLSRLWAGWQENFALQYRRENFTVGLDHGLSGFLVPEASWSRIQTDDPIDPSDARRLRFRISGAHEQAFSAASYVTLEAGAKWIRSLAARTRLIGRAETGYTWTRAFHRLPPSARFFAGGAQSVRGYGYNRLGERDAAGNVIGGTVVSVASLEYELRLFKQWGVAVFYDAGNAMTSYARGLEQGAGGGLRWLSPIGPVRADIGVPLTEPGRQPQFHLSIGNGL